MPNYAHAGFNVTGDAEELRRFAARMFRQQSDVSLPAQFDRPQPPRIDGPDPESGEGRKLTFDFNGIIPTPPEEDCPDAERWAVEHWGTKWNAQDVDVRIEPDNVWFQFSTAWDFPTPVFEALAAEFPTLIFAGSAYHDNDDLELVGEFNGTDDWGPGEIDWVLGGEDEEDEVEAPADTDDLSPVEDGGAPDAASERLDRDAGYDVVLAERFVVALEYAMRHFGFEGGTPNERPVVFSSALAGDEKRLHLDASLNGHDIVCLGYLPGKEQDLPVNIAVYERRDGLVNAWTECDPLLSEDCRTFTLRARRGDACFSFDGRSLAVTTAPRSPDHSGSFERGRIAVREIASAAVRAPTAET